MLSLLISLSIGTLFASGVYLLLQKSLIRTILGVMLLSNGANLVIFASGGLKTIAPIGKVFSGEVADPVPQALILTAIVIGLGVVAFFLVLILRTSEVTGTDDIVKIDSENS
jgi:multicomponent Na+:H+ antiporter subunit C